MTDDDNTKAPAPRRPGRPAKVRLFPRVVADPEPQEKPANEDVKLFAGLAPATCANDCNPENGCVITGNICGHPYKGGLQSAHRMQPAVMDRFERAKSYLRHRAIETADKQRRGA